MRDDGENIVLEFDMNGFMRDDIKVDVKDDSISIEAENKVDKKMEEEGYEGYEKSEKNFSYSSSLPEVIKDEAKINFEDGKLTIIIPKK